MDLIIRLLQTRMIREVLDHAPKVMLRKMLRSILENDICLQNPLIGQCIKILLETDILDKITINSETLLELAYAMKGGKDDVTQQEWDIIRVKE